MLNSQPVLQVNQRNWLKAVETWPKQALGLLSAVLPITMMLFVDYKCLYISSIRRDKGLCQDRGTRPFRTANHRWLR